MTPQLSKGILEFLNLDTTRNFLEAANNFIELLEKKDIRKEDFLKLSHSALIDLYSKGHDLQQMELKYSGEETEFDRDKIFDNKNAGLISEFGEETFYWEVFDPADSDWASKDREASQGSLVDDFADIYRDLKIEIEKINKIGTDEAIEDALWQLKFSFHNHWGQHCINALRYLHYYWYDNKL